LLILGNAHELSQSQPMPDTVGAFTPACPRV
jgi:hypothetical protein